MSGRDREREGEREGNKKNNTDKIHQQCDGQISGGGEERGGEGRRGEVD